MPKSKIHIDLLVQFFAANPDQVFALSDLEYLFIEKHREWNLPPSMTSYTFLEMLRTRFKLCELQLRSRHYSSLVLYAWEGKASSLSVALKIKKNGANLPKSLAADCIRSNMYCPVEMKRSMPIGNTSASKGHFRSGSRIEFRTASLPSLPIMHRAIPRTTMVAGMTDNLGNKSL
jgi:hypothetical protein